MPFQHETSKLHRLARNIATDVDYSSHALEEMEVDNISREDVETLLRRSAVTDVQPGERWRVSGKDMDGRYIEAIVRAYETELLIEVITAWDPKHGRRKKI